MGWTEHEDAHLWYLNIHENCGDDENYGNRPYHESVSLGSGNQETNTQNTQESSYGNNFSVNNTHWMFSLFLILIGFVVAVIYYLLVKRYQKCKGYESILENNQQKYNDLEHEQGVRNKKKKKRIMNTSSASSLLQ